MFGNKWIHFFQHTQNNLVNSRCRSYYLPEATQPKPIEWKREKRKLILDNGKNRQENL